MPISSSLPVMTASRRDKFKCTLLCFRSYVEDAAFCIALLGICLSMAFLLFIYHKEYPVMEEISVNNSNSQQFNEQRHQFSRAAPVFFLKFTLPSILLHACILVALITRVPTFCFPYLIAQCIGIFFIVTYFLVPDAYVLLLSVWMSDRGAYYGWNNTTLPLSARFAALNRFVVFSLVLLLQMWCCSIVLRTMYALNWERVSRKLAQENGGGSSSSNRQQQPQKSHTPPIMFKLEAPAANSSFWSPAPQQLQPRLQSSPPQAQQQSQQYHHHQQPMPTAPFAVVDG